MLKAAWERKKEKFSLKAAIVNGTWALRVRASVCARHDAPTLVIYCNRCGGVSWFSCTSAKQVMFSPLYVCL